MLASLKRVRISKCLPESEYIFVSEEEEQMVARLGGRGRGLVQALLRVRRERAGRTPQNCQRAQDNRMRPRQDIGPCDQKWRRDQEGFRHGGDDKEFWTVPQGQ